MTEKQKAAIEKVRKAIPSFDFYADPNGETHEIKEFKIEELNFGGYISLSVITGLKNDEGTQASIYCRKYRYIFIGPRGGFSATGRTTIDGKTKERKCLGFFSVMNQGYSN